MRNFHYCELIPSGDFVRFYTIKTGLCLRRVGVRLDGTQDVQGVLYDARTWSEGRARHHAEALGGGFTPAGGRIDYHAPAPLEAPE